MIIQENNFCFNDKNNDFIYDDNKYRNTVKVDNYDIIMNSSFIFNDEKNEIVKKQVIKRLGERRNLWKN